MRKIGIVAALYGALVAPQAFAQSGNFQGLSAGLGLNVADSTAESVVPGLSSKGTNTDANFLLQLQYNIAVSEVMVLGLTTGSAGISPVGISSVATDDEAKGLVNRVTSEEHPDKTVSAKPVKVTRIAIFRPFDPTEILID